MTRTDPFAERDPHRRQPGGGGQLLDDVRSFTGRFLALPNEHASTALVLWAAHTHAMPCWDSTPRLAPLSPEPGSGKTRVLEVLKPLVPDPVEAVNCTPAALFRKTADGGVTILFDEVDTLFGSRRQAEGNEDLRGLLNAGHRRSGKALRCVGKGTEQSVKEFPAYAAAALAGLGDLPDTLMSRSIVIRMRRRAPAEQVEPWRCRDHEPEGELLREQLADWLGDQDVIDRLATARPVMPVGLTDRAADCWEALLALADLAGGRWPAAAREAALWFVADAVSGAPVSLGVRLLADLRTVWRQGDEPEALTTVDLLGRLTKLEESPWDDLRGKPLDARRLARLLGGYGVKSRPVWSAASGGSLRGYRRDDLRDCWQRYLSQPPQVRDVRDDRESAGQDGSDPSHSHRTPAQVRDASARTDSPVTSGIAHIADLADLGGTEEVVLVDDWRETSW